MKRRSRPIMGTYLEIALSAPDGDLDPLLSKAFQQAESLAHDLSRFEPEGWLNRRRRNEKKVDSRPDLESLIVWGLSLEEKSKGAFKARDADGVLDLTGVAKGFIVDHVAAWIEGQCPAASGVINAGGDMRFLGEVSRSVTLRGAHHQCNIMVQRAAVATSLFESPHPSTEYPWPLNAWIGSRDAVSVNADSCQVADALTKVAMFGAAELAEILFAELNADLFVLRENGEILVNRFHP